MKSHFLKHGVLLSSLMIISVLAIFTFSSCNNEEIKINPPVINDNYYIKYVIKGNGAYGHFSNWTVTTPQGKYTNSGIQVSNWTQKYGPVNKGFKCEVQIGDYINGPPTIEIHASINQEPFTVKATKLGSSASYTIDF